MTGRQLVMNEFISAMYEFAPEGSCIMACQFRGDPNAEQQGKWRARPITCAEQLDDGANVYLAVSAMGKNERGEYRRRKENFAGGLLLMIDDIGTGPGSKFPMAVLDPLPPTALIETSPGNHQAVYMFSRPVTELLQFDALINGFIAHNFLGKDTGMAGINRVFRPPFGVNGKPKYGGWQVSAVESNLATRYSIEEIAAAFGIDISIRPPPARPRGATRSAADSLRAFVHVRQALRDAGMIKQGATDLAGWQNIVCPWIEGHTAHADTGAAIREPAEENGWVGAFRCHHGTCAGKGWKELTDWLSENQEVILESVNRNDLGFGAFHD